MITISEFTHTLWSLWVLGVKHQGIMPYSVNLVQMLKVQLLKCSHSSEYKEDNLLSRWKMLGWYDRHIASTNLPDKWCSSQFNLTSTLAVWCDLRNAYTLIFHHIHSQSSINTKTHISFCTYAELHLNSLLPILLLHLKDIKTSGHRDHFPCVMSESGELRKDEKICQLQLPRVKM